MRLLAELPLWQSMLLVVALPTILAVCGQIVVRRSVGLQRLTTNNEIAGFGAENLRAQSMMTAFLSLLTFTAVYAIVQINYPFTGPCHVESHALSEVHEHFAHKD